MITTPEVIDALVAQARPVRRLRHPVLRVAAWLLFAAVILTLIGANHGLRADLALRLQQPVFVIGVGAALLTAVLAAIAAFMLSLPDRSRAWLMLPLPSLLAWIGTMGYGCLSQWVRFDPGSELPGETLRCLSTLVFASLPLFLIMMVMLRHAALIRPGPVAAAVGLSVAAVSSTAMSLFHDFDASVMILAWNLGAAALVFAGIGLFAGKVLAWLAPMSLLRRRV